MTGPDGRSGTMRRRLDPVDPAQVVRDGGAARWGAMPPTPSPSVLPVAPPLAPWIAALCRRIEADGHGPVERVETHLSWVLLTPRHAYKIKKPVQLGFVDFSSLAARERACAAELRINRHFAGALYEGLSAVRGTPDAPQLDGDGPLLDWAVRMQRFAPGSLWVEHLAAGTLLPGHVDRLGRLLAACHAAAPAVDPQSPFGTAATISRTALDAYDALDAAGAVSGGRLRRWLEAQAVMLAPLWTERRAQDRVRECHGDLHLANIALIDDEPVPFDALEFDDALRCTDVMADVAFAMMDLLARGRRDLAYRFLNTYLEHGGDYAGLPVLRFYLVSRALVRARVALLRPPHASGADDGAPDYLALARELATQRDPRLLLMHGLPGSGKTQAAQGLLEAAGAVRVRADVERKRLVGLAPLARSRPEDAATVYGPAATARTYERLVQVAQDALRSGYPTIVDAANLRRSERQRFFELADRLGVPVWLLDCDADPALLRERVQSRVARGDDASEADLAVLERLTAVREPLDAGERARALRVDTGAPLALGALAADWLARRVDRP